MILRKQEKKSYFDGVQTVKGVADATPLKLEKEVIMISIVLLKIRQPF